MSGDRDNIDEPVNLGLDLDGVLDEATGFFALLSRI